MEKSGKIRNARFLTAVCDSVGGVFGVRGGATEGLGDGDSTGDDNPCDFVYEWDTNEVFLNCARYFGGRGGVCDCVVATPVGADDDVFWAGKFG